MSRRLVVFALLLAGIGATTGATFLVPEQHARIQDAIDLASSADTVLVGAGTYRERLSIRLKAVVLRSRDGADVTTIQGDHNGNVVTVNEVGRNCIIEGFTITGGGANHPDSVGAAIYLNQYASPTIQRCRLTGNRARQGGGVAGFFFCEPLVRECWISENLGGAVAFELGSADMGTTWAEVENCVIVNNTGFGVFSLRGARTWVRNCTIAFNVGDAIRSQEISRMRVFNCVLAHNGGAGVIRYDATACYTLGCNDVYNNNDGNYLGASPGDPCFGGRGSGDVSVEPCFQNAAADNYHLQMNSPLCALRGTGSCGVLGAYDDPCSPNPGQCVVTVEPASWGAVKSLYR
jgi:hypothetical protein